jgi:hypothetical protein
VLALRAQVRCACPEHERRPRQARPDLDSREGAGPFRAPLAGTSSSSSRRARAVLAPLPRPAVGGAHSDERRCDRCDTTPLASSTGLSMVRTSETSPDSPRPIAPN